MVLVDSSIWVNHFHRSDARLVALLESGEVLTHSLVLGELASGSLSPRRTTLDLLHTLPGAVEASSDEVLSLIERGRLWDTGLGVVDVHLLAAARLSDAALWTHDKALARAAERLGAM